MWELGGAESFSNRTCPRMDRDSILPSRARSHEALRLSGGEVGGVGGGSCGVGLKQTIQGRIWCFGGWRCGNAERQQSRTECQAKDIRGLGGFDILWTWNQVSEF